MRILLWSSTFWPHIGGVEVLGANLVDALTRQGHEITVLARLDSDGMAARHEVAGVPVHRLPFLQAAESRDAAQVARLRVEVAALKRTVDPEVVHLYHLGPDLMFHRLTRPGAHPPELVTLHQPFTGDLLDPDAALGRTLREADWIAACSQSVYHDLVGRIPEVTERAEVVINALPGSAPGRAPTPLPHQPTIVFVGRVVPQKGFDIGLEAVARAREAVPGLRASVVGDGVSRAELEEQAQALGLGEVVRFMGWADPTAVREAMEQATVVAMPSRFEPYGLVAVEAGQTARPVVAFAVEGLNEAVIHNETGLLVPPGDVTGLAAAFVRLLQDPAEATRLGLGGFDRYRTNHAWEAHVQKYLEIYERLGAGGA